MTEEKKTIQTSMPITNNEPIDQTGDSTVYLDEIELGRALNAVLFAAGYPVEYDKLSQIFSRDKRDMKRFVRSHSLKFNELGLGIMILTFDDKVQMCTTEGYKDFIRQALGIKMSGKLSNSLLEVLAIIAYNQPCTKLFIENVRGVDSSYALTSLAERELIEAKDRLEVPGRPLLYTTTDNFLRVFGVNSLDELPKSDSSMKDKENEELSDDDILKNFQLKD